MRPQVKSTIFVSVLGLSLALNAAFAIGTLRSAEPSTVGSADRQAKDKKCLLDRLDLDAEQQQGLAEMQRKMQRKRAAFWQRAGAIKVELANAICSPDMAANALDKQLDSYAKNQAAMQRAVAEHLVGVNAMLRPAQRGEFQTLLRTEMFRGMRSSQHGTVGEP